MHRIYYLLTTLAFAAGLGARAQSTPKEVSEADAVARLLGRTASAPSYRQEHRAAHPSGLKGMPADVRAVSLAQNRSSKTGNAPALTISGSLLYRYSWTANGQPQYGIYSFDATDPSSATPLALGSDYFAIGGGCYHDGVYSLVTYYDTMGALIASYHEYDTETWEETSFRNNVGVGSIAVDMTYDPVSHNIFGCFINDSHDGYVFGVLDPTNGGREAISNLQGQLYRFAMEAKVMNGFPERLEVCIGRGRTPEDMSITLLPAATCCHDCNGRREGRSRSNRDAHRSHCRHRRHSS